MNKITPHLWFDGQAEDAARFYTSIFNNSKIKEISRYGKEGAKVSGRPEGTAMTVSFTLEGQDFLGLNGGPEFKFSPAISFLVHCGTQKEVDHYWDRLTEGGKEVQCGWLEDKFGISWQIVPTILSKLLQDKDPKKSEKVMAAMLKMKKLDIDQLKAAQK